MIRFICWVFAVSLALGCGPKLVTVTVAMAKSAILAHQHDQMSYARFTRKLLIFDVVVGAPKNKNSENIQKR